MPVFKGTNNQGNVISWKSTTGRNQNTIFATEFTSETKRTAIYVVENAPLNLGGRQLVAYYDPGGPIVLTQNGEGYDENLQKLITTDNNFKQTMSAQTRYHVTNGLTLRNPDGSIGSSPSKSQVDNILGIQNPPAADPPASPNPNANPQPTNPSSGDPVSQPIDPNVVSQNDVVAKPSEEFSKILRYPLNESVGYDYLKIKIIEYVAGGVPRLESGNLGISDVQNRRETILGTIFLPMQPGISDNSGSSWNEDRLSPVQAAIGGLATDLTNSLGGFNGRGALDKFFGSVAGAQNIIQNNPSLGKFIDTYFAGQLVGSNLFARESGAVINPNLELLFNGPKMRTFNYNFRFTPRDDKEAKEIRSIIKVLKKNSLPKKDPQGLFLKTPNVFKLEYIFGKNGGEIHPYLNKIKTCALTDMSVQYTPDGSYTTYNDGSMTSYAVTLSFSELQPVYYDDFEDNSIDTPTTGY